MTPYLLFDFDGTIADSFGIGLQLFNSLAPKFHLNPIDKSQETLLRNMPTHKAIRHLKIPFYRIPALIPVFLKEYRNLIHRLKPFPQIHDTLEELRKLGIGMALLTSNARENVQEFLQNHDLDYFDWVESSKGLFTKQHTITHQIKKHKLHEHDVIYIGDETRDIFASHKCRIKIISVTWGLHTQNLLESYNPDFMADTPLQILSIVKNLLP